MSVSRGVAASLAGVLIALLAPACRPGTPAPQESDFERFVDAAAADVMRNGLVPGMSVAIANGSDLLLEKSYGRSDVENDVRATNETVYRIASITKQFTAAAILRLVEAGRVDLDADVVKYLPEFHSRGRRITVRQLLNHTSGIANMTDIPAFWAKERLDLTDAEVLALFQDEPPNFAPGENFLYNNSGFYMAAMIVERVTGESYAAHLDRTIFEPLGLRSTSVCDPARITPHRARGYLVEKGQLRNEPFISPLLPKGGGNLCSTAHDLVLWARALVSGKVVNPQSYALMTTPGSLIGGRQVGYGLGLFLSDVGGGVEVLHGGDFGSFTSVLAWYPAGDLIVAVLQNSGAAPAFDGHLARRLAGRLTGHPEPQLEEVPLDDAAFQRVAGTYRIGAASIEVRRDASRLVLSSTAAWHVTEQAFGHAGNGVFASIRNPEFRIRFSAGGDHAETVALTIHGRTFGDAKYDRQLGPPK